MYGIPSFDYGYGYGYGYGAAGSAAAVVILSLVALGAVIALSIFCYVKFMGKNGDADATVGKFKLGEFFAMKKLYLERFLKVLFMISAICIAVFSIATPFLLWAATGRFLGFLLGLVLGVVNLVLGEVLNRLGFEYFYMFVRMAGDTHAMREKLDDGLTIKETKE